MSKFTCVVCLLSIKAIAVSGTDPPINTTCFYSDHANLVGSISPAEWALEKAYLTSPCARMPTILERYMQYNALKTGEMTSAELDMVLMESCPSGKAVTVESVVPWADRMPNKVYAWNVDFHPAPAACNFPIYNDIGVVLHAEVDHKPFCEYNGVCRNRMKSIFGLGSYMVGFSLDPDHRTLKRDFYEAYKDDPEFHRVDAFICSHPAANCELFESFQKPMIVFATTRFEFGRNDQNIKWRLNEIRHWNAFGELDERFRNWTQFVIDYSRKGLLGLAANSIYDVEYIQYFTGIRAEYIPSWCGDLDGSYGRRPVWTGCLLPDNSTYNPTQHMSLIVPYKHRLWAELDHANDTNNVMFQEFSAALQKFSDRHPGTATPQIRHSCHMLTDHSPEVYKNFKSLIFIPYQSSTMTFFELYRQNIPIFAPSVELLIDWHQRFSIASGRIYGWPKREVDLVEMASGKPIDVSVPDPNDDGNLTSNKHWFPFFDLYVFDHVIQFTSWDHLLDLLSGDPTRGGVDLADISSKMMAANKRDRKIIANKWDAMFRKLLPDKKRDYRAVEV